MPILTLETKKYAIKIDNFEGPLDLLCHLIDINKMSIYDINLSEITDQYVDYLKEQEKMNLEIASEFLVMASTLLYIKSKNLLPKQEEEEEELTEEELIRRIIEYKKFKEISKVLKENYLEFSKRYFKNPQEIKLPKQILEKEYDKNVIPDIYKNLVERTSVKLNKNAKNIEKIAITDNYTVASKVKEMFKVLVKQKRFIFNKLFSLNQHNKQEVVTAFSGLLELSRRNKVETIQEKLFGDITVEKSNKNERRKNIMSSSEPTDISKTIMDTIKLLEEKLVPIKEVDEEKHNQMRKELDGIYEASKNKTLNAFETVNLLMKLQNEAITFMDTDEYKLGDANTTELTIYTGPEKGFFRKLIEKIKNKIFKPKIVSTNE